MAIRSLSRLSLCVLASAGAGLASLSGCARHVIVAYPTQVTGVLPPHQAALSPDYAQVSITRVAVVPLVARAASDQWWEDNLVRTLADEIATRQPQWDVMPTADLMRLIDADDLQAGLRSLESDYAAHAADESSLALSPVSQSFLEALRTIAGVDGVVVGSYTLSTQTKPVEDNHGRVLSYETNPVCDVRVQLIHTPSKSAWWSADTARSGPREPVVRQIAQTLASHIGKGARKQL